MSTGGGARRGRRDNGLDAAAFAVAGDVDPRIGEHLLDVLGAGGIAAYLQPASDLHPVTRTTIIPARPTDRLYVDRDHLSTAQDYLEQLAEPRPAARPPSSPDPTPDPTAAQPEPPTGADPPVHPVDLPVRRDPTAATGAEPGPSGADLDAAWAEIVADLKSDLDPRTGTWPEATENPEPTPRRTRTTGELADARSLLDGLDTFGAHLPDDPDDEGSYEPPPPPPLPRPSKAVVGSVLALVAGLVLFIWPSLAPIDAAVVRLSGFALCLAGVAGLVWRLRPGDDPDEEQDPDDGAVV